MEWVLKLPANGDRTTDFTDKLSLDSYSNMYGNDSSRGLLRFGLTPHDMRIVLNSQCRPKVGDRVFVRFNSCAEKAWRLRIVSEWKIVDFRSNPDNLPPVDADTEVVATVDIEKIQGINPLPSYPRYKSKGRPGLLMPLDEVNRRQLTLNISF